MFNPKLFFCLISIFISVINALPSGENIEAGDRHARILGGRVSKVDEHQYHVAILQIESDGKSKLICGGAIISPRYVLTGAHCVYGLSNKELVIRSGWDIEPEFDYADERSFHRVSRIMYPKEYFHSYCRHHQNDLAILKVQKNFDLMDEHHYKKVDLPEHYNDYEYHQAVFTGYGLHAYVNRTGVYSKKLRYFKTEVIPNVECQTISSHIITDSNLCTAAKNKQGLSCTSDNGGPLVYDGAVIGIRNSHNMQCLHDEPEVFTRVSHHLDFVYKVLHHEFSADIVYVPNIEMRH